jgi:hypothetical protein
LDGLTSSSSATRRGNPRAWWSLACGLLSLAAIPIGIVLARELEQVTLVDSSGSVLAGALRGWIAIVLARRARERIQITLGRAGGGGAARVGRLLGILGLLVAGTAALALGFWGLLSMFAEQ